MLTHLSLSSRFAVLMLMIGTLASSPFEARAQFYSTKAGLIVDRNGDRAMVRGIGLGGWLMPEGYMLRIHAPDGGSPRTIRNQIENLIGPDDTDLFFTKYQENYVAEADIEAIASWGFDHIRLPFHYEVFYDPGTGSFKEDGFALLDTFLNWCRAVDIPVILDMHATPGAQNSLNISDSDGQARLWTEPDPYQDQLVAIWVEIARRYHDDTLIAGYDLINEPVLPDGVTAADMRALYERLVLEIRKVDPNHIVFIEGNWFATDFSGLTPPFDDNMVYAFHKYWNDTTIATIQYLLAIRSAYGVPLWLGESGENSNTWFYEVTRLMESLNIGWNWWTHKKIDTITSPLSAPVASGYEEVIRYWRGEGPRPSAEAAKVGLFNMAEGLALAKCEFRQGVIAALFDPDFNSRGIPYTTNTIPGVINAADYDIGNQGVTYSDADYKTMSGSPGGGNRGGKYRNDGVDIEESQDPAGFDFNVGHIEDGEWMEYSVNVMRTATYDVSVRVASAVGGGRFTLLLDGTALGETFDVPDSGGWQTWYRLEQRDIEIAQGAHKLRLVVEKGGFNVNQLRFTWTEDDQDRNVRFGFQGVYPNPASDSIQVLFETLVEISSRLQIVDLQGRSVYSGPWKHYDPGIFSIGQSLPYASGSYFVILEMDDGISKERLSRLFTLYR